MAYGIEIHNTEGSILLGNNEQQYGYFGKTVAGVGSVPTGKFLSFAHWPTQGSTNNSPNSSSFPTGDKTVYYFVPFADITNTGAYGIELYDENGVLYWHTGAPPLMLHSVNLLSPVITFTKIALSVTASAVLLDPTGGIFDGQQLGRIFYEEYHAIGASIEMLGDDIRDAQITDSVNWTDPNTTIPIIDAAYYDQF